MKNNRKKTLQYNHKKADGEPCKAIANKQTGLCAVHSGIAPRANTKIDLDMGIVHIKKYLTRLMIDTRKGRVKPQVSNSIANLVLRFISSMTNLFRLRLSSVEALRT